MTFHIGQKVVCVDDVEQRCAKGDSPVKKGSIYTVREYYDFFGLRAIRIEEIMNANDRGYHASRFRPIVERKTDISVFTEILRKATKKIPALIGNERT